MDENERAQIFDAMFPEIHLTGDVIIQQGEKGENFYIIDKGEVNVSHFEYEKQNSNRFLRFTSMMNSSQVLANVQVLVNWH